jgi:hypothetical protein
MPADAQKSPDGNYWWDGAQWQPVDQSQAGQAGQAQGADQSQGGGAQAVAMTDDHFANMLAAAEQSVAEG